MLHLRTVVLFFSLVLISAFACSLVADQTGFQDRYAYGDPAFEFDAVDFRSDSVGVNSLEVYYKLYNFGLSFVKTDTGYTAAYEVNISLLGDDDIPLDGQSKRGQIFVKRFNDTRSTTDFLINKFEFKIKPQDLRIKAFIRDEVSGETLELKRDYDLTNFRQKYPTLSPAEFIREYRPAEGNSKFNRGGYWIVPNVARIYGESFDSLLTFYQEVYPGEKNSKYLQLITRIYHKDHGYLYTDSIKLGEIKEPFRQVRTINVGQIMPAEFQLETKLIGRRGREFYKINDEFEIMLTAERIFKTDYETAVKMLKYLATKDEMKALEKAKTQDERRKLWDDFWKLRDNNPSDSDNPAKGEYFRRIRHANRNFSYMGRDGWKSDRGSVYITYGEPDEVEDFPFELASRPYQIWHYYKIYPPRTFTFVDEWGDGIYELQPPYNGIR